MANKYSRRNFLEHITTGILGAWGAGTLFSSLGKVKNHNPQNLLTKLPDGATILFQGDSITDAGRDKKNSKPNDPWALGQGYSFLAAAGLRHQHAAKNLQCYNRGISGNKVFQLADRWQQDCLALQPDLLSILIGVNDFWHTLSGNYDGTVEIYEKDFRALLNRTREQLPEVQLVIGEPFVVEEGTAVDESWFPDFRRYQQVARQIADEFDAAFIPYQQIFDQAAKEVAPTYWTADGVHPTMAGSQLMARAWLERVAGI